MDKWDDIQSILNKNLSNLDEQTKVELIQKITIYHEELYFQNDELKRINHDLESLKNEYKNLYDNAPIGYVTVDSNGQLEMKNKLFIEWFDDKTIEKFSDFVSPQSQDEYYFFMRKLIKNNYNRETLLMVTKEGEYHFDVIGRSLYNESKKYHIAFINVEEQFQSLKKIKNLSFKDQLTGLYNRRYYEEELKRLNNIRMMPLSVILADVNGLKLINDAFGHQAGDELLIQSAKVMRLNEREIDLIARIGGDEFAILLPKTNKKQCNLILNRLSQSCSDIKVDDISFSISFGAATMYDTTENIEEVISKAEESMYRAKLLEETSNRAEVIKSILMTLHLKHEREENHSKRVSKYMKDMAIHMNLSNSKVELMSLAGLLHDIGKIAIDYSILDKATDLSEEDYEEIKRHPEIGFRILKSSSVFSEISEIVLYHHERYDGAGYPRGISGENIRLESRILCVCDAYDAMISDRPYRKGMKKEAAILELKKNAGSQFDKKIVDAFVDMMLSKQD